MSRKDDKASDLTIEEYVIIHMSIGMMKFDDPFSISAYDKLLEIAVNRMIKGLDSGEWRWKTSTRSDNE